MRHHTLRVPPSTQRSGLLGQTYDGDGIPIHGKRDSYAVLDDGRPTKARRGIGGVITTRAQGEGAIEGTAEMYRVRRPFDTNFAFSRFGAVTPWGARNVSQVRGRARIRTKTLHAIVVS